jgi:hypothetical protein
MTLNAKKMEKKPTLRKKVEIVHLEGEHDHLFQKGTDVCAIVGCGMALCGVPNPNTRSGCNLPKGHEGMHMNTFNNHQGKW